jgi:hypothetical protein
MVPMHMRAMSKCRRRNPGKEITWPLWRLIIPHRHLIHVPHGSDFAATRLAEFLHRWCRCHGYASMGVIAQWRVTARSKNVRTSFPNTRHRQQPGTQVANNWCQHNTHWITCVQSRGEKGAPGYPWRSVIWYQSEHWQKSIVESFRLG